MTLHIKTLAGEPSVTLIECPSAGMKAKRRGMLEDASFDTARRFKDSLYKYTGACTGIADQGNIMVCNLTEIFNRYDHWMAQLPRVTPFYAVKCNTDLPLIKVLANCGANFDCASKAEIETVLNVVGDAPSRVIFANPTKFQKDMRFASRMGVKRTTFDGEFELRKLAKCWPDAECVLRICPDHFKAQCDLSQKFGAPLTEIPSLLSVAKELGLNVMGISFHVGSGCFEATAWAESVRMAKKVSEMFEGYGFEMRLLDIGGGFPGNSPDMCQGEQPSFTEICYHLRTALDAEFPKDCGVEIIAEPGRYFASAAYTAAVQVFAKRSVMENGELIDLAYGQDGVYGIFSNKIFDHQKLELSAILSMGEHPPTTMKSIEINSENKEVSHKASAADLSMADRLGDTLETLNLNGKGDSVSDEDRRYLQKKLKDQMSVDVQNIFEKVEDNRTEMQKTRIYGPTCDGLDELYFETIPKLNLDDWLVWRDMGAYTIASATNFNGMPRAKLFYFMYSPTPKQVEMAKKALDLSGPMENIL